jgi:hypothetical protein
LFSGDGIEMGAGKTVFPLGSTTNVFKSLISVDPELIAVAFMIINEPEFDTLLGPRMSPKIFTTVPEELLIIPLLKNVPVPFCLKRVPSVILFTLSLDLSNWRFICAPAIAVPCGSMITLTSNVWPSDKVSIDWFKVTVTALVFETEAKRKIRMNIFLNLMYFHQCADPL